jgi:peptidoglycan-associated lipoprotein
MITRHGRLTLLVSLAALVMLAGCAKRPALSAVAAPAPTGVAAPVAPPAPPAPAPPPPAVAQPAPAPAPLAPATPPPQPAPPPPPAQFTETTALGDVHFDFDRYDIRPDARKVLDANAGWLTANRDQLLLVEGHCDERGTNEYNLALGERRAKAVMAYLVSKGVAGDRITIVSYGEERPQCTAHTEACWARNRRAHFLVKGR